MAKNLNRQRKEELIASLNQKRESIAEKATNLQQTVRPNLHTPLDTTEAGSATTDSQVLEASNVKSVRKAVQKLSITPFIGKALDLKKSKLSTGIINRKAAKPILIGLGASVVVMALMESRKRTKKKKAEKGASIQATTKPAVGFLILKTALSVLQPALKQIVKNQVAKRS